MKETIHEQIAFSCIRNGEEVEIECDKGIMPLIKDINEAGFITCYSCEGDERLDAYVGIKNPHGKNLAVANEIVNTFFRDSNRIVTIEINSDGTLIFRAWIRKEFLNEFINYSDTRMGYKCIIATK